MAQVFGQALHGGVHFEHIIAVDLHGLHAVSRAFIHEGFEAELLITGRAQAVTVVFNHENNRQLPYGGHVQGLVEVAFAGPAVAGVGERHFGLFLQQIGQGNATGHGQLRSEVRNHTHNVVLVGTKVEAAVPALSKAQALTLPLRKQAPQRHLAPREHAQVAVQRQNVLIRFQCQRATHRNGLLSDARKPLTHLALAQ